jgi:hypothetical protein
MEVSMSTPLNTRPNDEESRLITKEGRLPSMEWLPLLWAWFVETLAFSLLPLCVYAVTYMSLQKPAEEIIKLPEWMFISIILYGDTLRRLILFYRKYKGFELKVQRDYAGGVVGITISAILLNSAITASLSKNSELPSSFYVLQTAVFALAMINSAYTRVWLAIKQGEGDLLLSFAPDRPDQGNPSKG